MSDRTDRVTSLPWLWRGRHTRPVDDTTATAPLTPAAAWGHEVDTGVTAAERLLAQATIAKTGAQVAATVTA